MVSKVLFGELKKVEFYIEPMNQFEILDKRSVILYWIYKIS
jgi:hypothetical protein